MTEKRVPVVSTGGTIASTAGDGGASPTESGAALVDAVPELDGRVRVEELARRPSPDVDFALLERLRERVAALAAEGCRAVVVTHGTDTLVESAYYLDLVLDGGKNGDRNEDGGGSRDGDGKRNEDRGGDGDGAPAVVFTGAQRRPDEPGADGPANLLAAVAAAEEPSVRTAGGVYACLDGELHAARDVVKAHAWRVGAFTSPGKGPVAVVGPAGFERYRDLGSRSGTVAAGRGDGGEDGNEAGDDGPPAGDVPVVSTGIGVGRGPVDRAVEAGCDGVVLRATGLGNAPEPVADAVADAVDAGVPVVVTSRCHAGGVAPVYGGGGGRALADAGAVMGGDRPASKARIALLVALAAGVEPSEAFDGG
jgi:L-asparaginase